MQEEVWKPIVGYETRYEVSNAGNVRSIPQLIKTKSGWFRRINPVNKTVYSNNKNGYSTVCLVFDDKSSNKLLHRVVAKAFIPNPENKACVNHKNGIKSDNRVENLEWVTHSENNKHAWDNNLLSGGNKYHLYRDKVIKMYLCGIRKSDISSQLGIPYISVWRFTRGIIAKK